jgi:putative membrane protein
LTGPGDKLKLNFFCGNELSRTDKRSAISEVGGMMDENKTLESKYIQQHLANERTYLAWVRTSIAIIGIGFLASSLHFNNISFASKAADTIAVLISIFSLVIGFVILFFATTHYFSVRKNINSQTFASASTLIQVSTGIIFIIFLLLGIYLISILF